MSSAILMMYTSEGFLVAADGRSRLDGKLLSDTTQKIFPIKQSGKWLAYALGGEVGLTDRDNAHEVLLDLREEMAQGVRSLEMSSYSDLAFYGKKLSGRLRDAVVRVQAGGRATPFRASEGKDEPAAVACLLMGGYFERKPSWITVQFSHQNQRLLQPLIKEMELDKGYVPSVTYGSKEVGDLLFSTDDPRFARYRVPRKNLPDDVTLSEAAEVAKNYILACSDPEAMKIDEKHCAGIGGHIHIAAVTPALGFEWIIPPVP
ncbi:MAG: hypothetical protein WAQ52_07830 [Terriglobales bacterium]